MIYMYVIGMLLVFLLIDLLPCLEDRFFITLTLYVFLLSFGERR